MGKSIALEILERHCAQCSDYHKHKETITWTALGLYLMVITAVIGFISANKLTCENRNLFTIAAIVIYLLMIAFINQQLYWKRYELSAMNSANKVFIVVANGAENVNAADYVIPDRQFLPKIILEEMGWNGEKRFKFKNIGIQRYVVIYTNLSITVLTILAILSLAIN